MDNPEFDYLSFTMMITAVSNLLAEKMDDDELALAAAALTQMADTLAAIAVLRTFPKSEENKKSDEEAESENQQSDPG